MPPEFAHFFGGMQGMGGRGGGRGNPQADLLAGLLGGMGGPGVRMHFSSGGFGPGGGAFFSNVGGPGM